MKRSSFTLIELLIVIAIIALLAAISIIVSRASKQRARTVLCSSRVKQVTLDLLMYEADNETFPYGFVDSFTPPPGGYPGSPLYNSMGWWWFNFLKGYDYKENPLLRCPSKSLSHPVLSGLVPYGNYGVNRSICKNRGSQILKEEFVGTPLGAGDVTGGTLLVTDSGYGLISWWHAADTPPVPLDSSKGEDLAYVPGLGINRTRKLLPGQEHDAVKGRHPNATVNIGFAGGHVTKTKADDLFVEKMADGYANKTPLWSPQ